MYCLACVFSTFLKSSLFQVWPSAFDCPVRMITSILLFFSSCIVEFEIEEFVLKDDEFDILQLDNPSNKNIER